MLPSVSLWEGIRSSLLDIDGVTRVSGIKNDTGTATAEGVPGHSIALVVEGGDAQTIGQTIFLKKGEGVGTFGSTSTTYCDSYGFTNTINFSRPTVVDTFVTLTITPGVGYFSTVDDEIRQRIASYISSLAIGDDVNIARVLASAVKDCSVGIDTRFEVDAITMGISADSQSAANIQIAWNEAAFCDPENVMVVVNES